MKNFFGSLTLLGTILAASNAWAGPVSQWYMAAGDQSTNWIIQGATVTSFAQQHSNIRGEYAIAVTDSIKTLASGNCAGINCGLGSQYSLSGAYTGTDYSYPPVKAYFYDGTSDGTNNYSVDFGGGGVYRFDSNWANPDQLFNVGRGNIGITYDTSDDTLWISQFEGNLVRHYSLAGALLNQFTASQFSLTSLALDSADDTLWMGSQTTKGTFYQYSKTGMLLDTQAYADLLEQNTLGGEFVVAKNQVPEPSSLVLTTLGLIGFGMKKRRKSLLSFCRPI